MGINYRDKIRKLLALSQSPVEAEAKAALLKARELMAKHKLSLAELEQGKAQRVKNVVLMDISASKRRDPWVLHLTAIIAENYCCRAYRSHGYGKQTQHVGLIGLDEDVEVCIDVLRYAVKCIRAGVELLKIENKNEGYPADYSKEICDSYGYGFAEGIKEAFAQQQNQEGWGLILAVPPEVEDAAKKLGHKQFTHNDRIILRHYQKGFEEGKEFSMKKRLKGDSEDRHSR